MLVLFLLFYKLYLAHIKQWTLDTDVVLKLVWMACRTQIQTHTIMAF